MTGATVDAQSCVGTGVDSLAEPGTMAGMSESCASCRFFAPSAARGVCRRRPPVWTGPDDTHDEGMFAFPSVHPTSWCGEYEHGEVQSMLQAVRDAESDKMLTPEEAEAFSAVRPNANVEAKALPKRVTLTGEELDAIKRGLDQLSGIDDASATATMLDDAAAATLRALLKRTQ